MKSTGPQTAPIAGRYYLGQASAQLLSATGPGDNTIATLGHDDEVDLLGQEEVDGATWLRVRGALGKEGLLPGDTVLCVRRFMVERAAFIGVVAIALSPLGAKVVDRSGSDLVSGILGGAAWIAVSPAIIYGFGKSLFGVGGFHELVPRGTEIPRFDWLRFAREPLRLVGVVLVFGIGIGLIAAVRACSQ